jgi:alpha-ribazole phosphatase/probable phosphoglycerate mutase
MQITYFVHSITLDNEKGLATGWLPGALSAEGIARAKKLGKELKTRSFDAVFCSDLYRAIQSTELFFENRHPVFIDWRLRECNYGDLDGTPTNEFKKDHEQDYIHIPYKNGESYIDVQDRISRFLEDTQTRYQDGHIAIVAHQAPQLALDVLIKNNTWEEAIEKDWRRIGSWQPGWEYTIINK